MSKNGGGLTDPTIIDVVLSPADVVLERWTISCDSPTLSSPSVSISKTYKKCILLIRSLYSLLRLLPCFKIFKLLNSSISSYDYGISYRISSFAAPFSREEESGFDAYTFAPVETQFGNLSLSVTYRTSITNFEFDLFSSVIEPANIITDYVGSPAADPMRAFPARFERSNSNKDDYFRYGMSPSGSRPISFPTRGRTVHVTNSYDRPHSWSDARSQPIDVYGSNRGLSRRYSGLSPALLSDSPTPSPPVYGSSGNNHSNFMHSRSKMDTAPVSIPVSGFAGKHQTFRTPNHSDPTRTFLPPPSPRSTRMEHSSQESRSLDVGTFKKLEAVKLGDVYSNLHMHMAQKGLKDGRDDSGRFSGAYSSTGSPRLGFSRSSSRMSVQDDLDDDIEFPFAVDDVDTPEASYTQSRKAYGKEAVDSFQSNSSSHKSQEAAVGALVHMLRTAPPLRQDQSFSSQHSRSDVNSEAASSSYFMSRKTSDALQELKTYKEMKQVILSQSKTELLNSVNRSEE